MQSRVSGLQNTSGSRDSGPRDCNPYLQAIWFLCCAQIDIAQGHTEGPVRPLLVRYPTKLQQGAKRSFQSSWYKEHDWLEYSQSLDAAFCFPCRLFSVPGSCPDKAFTVNGFSNWKKAMYKDGGFVSHLKSDCHVHAVIAWRDLDRKDAAKSVLNMLTDEQTRQIQENRNFISVVIDVLKFTCIHRLSQRGHDETAASVNAGNSLTFFS